MKEKKPNNLDSTPYQIGKAKEMRQNKNPSMFASVKIIDSEQLDGDAKGVDLIIHDLKKQL